MPVGRLVLRETLWEPRFNLGWASLLAFVLGASMLVSASSQQNPIQNVLVLLLGGVIAGCAAFGLWCFFTTRLELDSRGFTYRRGARTWRREWPQCSSIAAVSGRGGPHLVITYTADLPPISLFPFRPDRMDILASTFGFGAERVALAMEHYRKRAGKRRRRARKPG